MTSLSSRRGLDESAHKTSRQSLIAIFTSNDNYCGNPTTRSLWHTSSIIGKNERSLSYLYTLNSQSQAVSIEYKLPHFKNYDIPSFSGWLFLCRGATKRYFSTQSSP